VQTFSIAPAASKAVWFLPAILVPVLLIVVVVTYAAVHGARNARFEVSPDGLRLSGDLYGRFIPAAQLRTDEARRVDFGSTPGLAPSWKTMGTALPGYQSGWFRLKNGDKALVYLTDRSRAVYVPTTAGYGVLVSPEQADAFVSALSAMRR
jgi:PH (Pleckstrin Homology) domain-containing protein